MKKLINKIISIIYYKYFYTKNNNKIKDDIIIKDDIRIPILTFTDKTVCPFYHSYICDKNSNACKSTNCSKYKFYYNYRYTD